MHHLWVGRPPSARGRTKPGLKTAGPDGTFPGRKGWGRGSRRAGGPAHLPGAPSPIKFATGTWEQGQGPCPEPQLPPREHLWALPAERRPWAQLQTEGAWGGGTLHSLVIRETSTRQTGRHALLALKQTICHLICPHAAPTTWEMPATSAQGAPQASLPGSDSPSCPPPPQEDHTLR